MSCAAAKHCRRRFDGRGTPHIGRACQDTWSQDQHRSGTRLGEAEPGGRAATRASKRTALATDMVPDDHTARADSIPLRFTRDDVELFAEASHDRNPLHRSSTVARKSPYGEPIVFGMLSAISCLGRLRDRPGKRLATVSLEFKAPLFIDTEYVVETDDHSDAPTARVRDGSRVALTMAATFRAGSARIEEEITASAPFQLELEADDLDDGDLVVGRVVSGRYAPAWSPLRSLARRLGLRGKGVSTSQVVALLWASYLVGMRMPGRRALFWRADLRFEPLMDGGSAELTYDASVLSFDKRFGLLKVDARLFDGPAAFARGELWSFARSDVSVARSGAVASAMQPSGQLEGMTALVIGASRGLGAALAQALALKGCTVFASFLRSGAEAELLKQSVAHAPGSMVLMQGDGSDPSWCERTRLRIVGDCGRLDFLVCSAFPPPLPLSLEAGAVKRINEYVTQSFALVSTPMASFLPMLGERAGWCVAISSEAVKEPPPDWPHYVSAKYAIEGLTAAAATGYRTVRFLIVRPPALRTDMTNTPLQRQAAISPELVAIQIVERLSGSSAGGSVELLEDFARG